MSQVLINQETTITIAISDGSGDAVTGLTSGDVVLYYRKAGGVATEKTLDAQSFSEIDATNMPGLYEVAFTAAELNTKGEFVGTLRQDGAISFETAYIRLEVVTDTDALIQGLEEDALTIKKLLATADDKTTTQITEGSPYSFPVRLTLNSEPVTVTETGAIKGTVVKGNGSVSTLELDPLTNWQAVSGVNHLYMLSLDASYTDVVGELLITLEESVALIEATAPAGGSFEDVYLSGAGGAAWAVGSTFGEAYILQSSDGGQSWTEDTNFLANPGTLFSVGGRSPTEVYVGSFNFSLYYWDGATWTTLTSAGTSVNSFRAIHAPVGTTDVWLAGWVSNLEGQIARWDGVSLTVEHTNNSRPYRDIYDTGNRVWAVGNNRTITEGIPDGLGSWDWTERGSEFTDIGTASNITAIDFAEDDANYGWLVSQESVAYKTLDNGATWESVQIPLSDVRDVQVVSTTEIWIVAATSGYAYTKDGGSSWTVESPNSFFGESLDILDSSTGIIATPLATISASEFDTKEIQVQVVEPPALVGDTKEVDNTTTQITQGAAYSLPLRFSGTQPVSAGEFEITLIKSEGDAVTKIPTSSEWASVTGAEGVYRLQLSPEDTDTLGELLIILDPNFGLQDAEIPENSPIFTDVYLDSNIGWATTDENTTIIKTSDGGQTWDIDTDFPGGPTLSIDGTSNTDVWVGGDSGHTLWQWDGTTWEEKFSDGTSSAFKLNAIHADLNFGVFVAGEAGGFARNIGKLFKWDADLETLEEIYEIDQSSSLMGFYNIRVISDNEVWAVGQFSQVLQGVYDSGSGLWNFTNRTEAGDFPAIAGNGTVEALDFLDNGSNPKEIGWVGNQNGSVYKTEDGGQTWTQVTFLSLDFRNDLKAFKIFSADEIWAITEDFIAKTFDGGASWQIALETPFKTVGSHFEDNTSGVLVGDSSEAPESVVVLVADGLSDLAAKEIQVQVVEQGVVPSDLTPITTALSEIKGATFDEATDALDVLRDAVDGVAGSVDLSTVEASLEEIKGTGFDTNTHSLEAIRTSVDEVREMSARILGLSQENIRITNQEYDENNNLVGSTLSVYENPQDVVSQTSPLATYELTASYNSDNRLVDYRIVRTA